MTTKLVVNLSTNSSDPGSIPGISTEAAEANLPPLPLFYNPLPKAPNNKINKRTAAMNEGRQFFLCAYAQDATRTATAGVANSNSKPNSTIALGSQRSNAPGSLFNG